jgi:hypothetical protein
MRTHLCILDAACTQPRLSTAHERPNKLEALSYHVSCVTRARRRCRAAWRPHCTARAATRAPHIAATPCTPSGSRIAAACPRRALPRRQPQINRACAAPAANRFPDGTWAAPSTMCAPAWLAAAAGLRCVPGLSGGKRATRASARQAATPRACATSRAYPLLSAARQAARRQRRRLQRSWRPRIGPNACDRRNPARRRHAAAAPTTCPAAPHWPHSTRIVLQRRRARCPC